MIYHGDFVNISFSHVFTCVIEVYEENMVFFNNLEKW